MRNIRILIVDDSPSVATLLQAILSSEPDMEVIGQARDGRDAVALTQSLEPDLITMDVRMPVMDGFEATAQIMKARPTPIIIVTSAARDHDLRIGFRALEAGALSVIEKPVGIRASDFDPIRKRLVRLVRAMSEIKVMGRLDPSIATPAAETSVPILSQSAPEIVGIGASTGGPQALQAIVSTLPGDYPAPIVVVQHMSPGFVGGLASWLAEHTSLRVKLAENGERLLPGTVYLAPDDLHLLVRRRNQQLVSHLDRGPALKGFRPSATPMLRSIARTCAGRAVGVALTGMGDDGVQGLLAMREAGCETIAQDRASSVVFGMPSAAIQAGAAARVLALDGISHYLICNASSGR